MSSGLGASFDVQSARWAALDDGTQLIVATLHCTSKYQRSGVLLHFLSPSFLEFRHLAPLHRQPTVAGAYGEDSRGAYRHYIQRPWGDYAAVIHMNDRSDLLFSYKFEGSDEVESEPVSLVLP